MRRRGIAALGAGTAAAAAAAALLAGPWAVSSVAADELVTFEDCAALKQWYVDAALPQVGPWGLGPGPVVYDAMRTTAVAGSTTGTNVQEAGVDEPDVAKTDGTLVAHVRGRDVVLTDVSGAEAREVSQLRLPGGMAGAELLLLDDRIVVTGHEHQPWGVPIPVDTMSRTVGVPPGAGQGAVRVVVVDISDPSEPHIEHDATYGGDLVSARQYDQVVRLVLSTTTPSLDFVQPGRGRSAREATRENRRRVRESSIGDWLPRVEDGGGASPLVACEDVQHPEMASGFGTVSVVSFTAEDPGERHATAVTTSGRLVYSSSDRLYLATPGYPRAVTDVHAFTLDGLDTTYTASGEVPGRVRDRWSFDEHDGHLRVATALGRDAWNPRENAVVVLEERGADLDEIGRVAAMGIEEQIRSVRWFDDLAVVVTFRQVDPLYAVDLTDPAAPRVLGELKIPGFSAYLHPLGGGLLLGLGQDASRQGRIRGAQAAVFDLGDLTSPRRVDTALFGRHTEFVAAWDPRAFTYLPEQRTVLAPVQEYWHGRARLAVLAIGEDGTLTRTASEMPVGRDGAHVRTLPVADGRVALVGTTGVSLLDLTR
jgi:hypothetical protein